MLENGGTGALHRYFTVDTFKYEISQLLDFTGYGITVGADLNIAEEFLQIAKNPSYVIIDIAHGHSKHMKNAIKYIRSVHSDIPIIAGNICTPEAARDLIEWGASATKIGISAGGVCSTRKIAGVGFPQWSAVKNVAKIIREINKVDSRNIKLISDGGHKLPGDCAKALGAGADFVMLGSMLAGTKETPGDVLTTGFESQKKVKLYQGSASHNAQIVQYGKEKKNVYAEGAATFVPYKGPVEDVLFDIVKGIQSALSYCGCWNLEEFHEYCEMDAAWNLGTFANFNEGRPHVVKEN
jgi:IMP dehydrogenase